MSYKIEPMPLITFVENSELKLPRFQRKATWNKKQNFELCISVFQDYPVGVVIVNKERNASWLLDGRQRRNALKLMRENPVEVYNWAKAYIGFNQREDEGEIIRLYWDKVEKYLQKEDRPTTEKNDDNDDDNSNVVVDDEDINVYDEDDEEELESSFDSEKQKQGLKLLLDIVLMVHQIRQGISRWEKTFDYKEYCSNIKYQLKRENYAINPSSLRRFLLELSKSVSTLTEEEFIAYYDDNTSIKEGKEDKFKALVNKNWDYIKNSIELIAASEKVFEEGRIGIITLSNVSQLDAQNIFSRINKGGTQLKAEELLSAKPYWNEVINNADNETQKYVRNMYKILGVEEPAGIVRWDLAATLVSRIDKKKLIFDSETPEDQLSLDRVTLGFKLLSSIFVGGMSGKSVSDLEMQNSVNWDSDVDDVVSDINTVCEILMNDNFFKYYQTWDKPISKLLGNAISLEFIAILLEDWEDKQKPTVSGTQFKAFQRDARILFDKLVFEYSTKVWRGSGDSKMASDIKDWRARLVPVSSAEWETFINGALEGVYNGQTTTQKTLTPILYYYYAINNMEPPSSSSDKIEVDHIIPKEKFEGNVMANSNMRDSLTNLALLPKSENAAKKSKALKEITDTWLKDQITKYEGIEEKEFVKYSDISNIDEMKRLRGELFKKSFKEKRNTLLAN